MYCIKIKFKDFNLPWGANVSNPYRDFTVGQREGHFKTGKNTNDVDSKNLGRVNQLCQAGYSRLSNFSRKETGYCIAVQFHFHKRIKKNQYGFCFCLYLNTFNTNTI